MIEEDPRAAYREREQLRLTDPHVDLVLLHKYPRSVDLPTGPYKLFTFGPDQLRQHDLAPKTCVVMTGVGDQPRAKMWYRFGKAWAAEYGPDRAPALIERYGYVPMTDAELAPLVAILSSDMATWVQEVLASPTGYPPAPDHAAARSADQEFEAKPNGCDMCPDGCGLCSKDRADCECYTHQGEIPLLAQFNTRPVRRGERVSRALSMRAGNVPPLIELADKASTGAVATPAETAQDVRDALIAYAAWLLLVAEHAQD